MMHPNGTPAWIDLMTTDLGAAQAFYGTLFAWTFEDQVVDGAVAYVIARQQLHDAAGIAARTAEERRQGISSAWNLFFATDDLDGTVQRGVSLGATVLSNSATGTSAGRMAVLTDPTGALFCLWQADQLTGLGATQRPGALTWCECLTPDRERATTFYEKLFSWKTEVSTDLGVEYTLCQTDGTPIAGIMETPAGLTDVPANWMVYFGTDDCSATIADAEQAGGTLLNGPMDYPTAKFAVIADPQGAVFGIIEPLA